MWSPFRYWRLFCILTRCTTIKLCINKWAWVRLLNNPYFLILCCSGSLLQCIKQHFSCLYSCDWLFSPNVAGESASCGGADSTFTAVCVLTRGRLLRRRRRGVIQKRGRGQETGVRNDAERVPKTKKSHQKKNHTYSHIGTHTLTLWHLSPQAV